MIHKKPTWKTKLYEIIYEADTPAGKLFDIILLLLILLSVSIAMLESVASINQTYSSLFYILEWGITILFTIEYILRVLTVNKPLKYIFSFYGLIDLLSTLPKYIGIFIFETKGLSILRALRLLRIFRILKLVRFLGASNTLINSLKASRAKIGVFLYVVVIFSILLGTLMYLVEGNADSGFTSIPKSIYWTIVTMTTVGYGDIAPATTLGQIIASIVMVLGYGILAVPTGIVSAEFVQQKKINTNTQVCENCHEEDHFDKAKHCHSCGKNLHT
ncbi:ion transporter [Flavobacteriaceae bacterium]|nr:ion transporter [Flavobacteriaceae bacterium]